MSFDITGAGKAALLVLSNLSAVLLLVAVLSTAALAGDLRAYFDRNSVYEGDTVTLVIETTSGTLGQPDLSSLDADFDLLGTSQSTNISIVNGRRTDSIRLLVSLAPRRTGTIEVPPIEVGGEQTDPLTLRVSEAPEAGSGGSGDDIFVELELGPDFREPVVQQQVPLTVRLFAAVPLLKGSLDDPRADGALVTKLGEDREYHTRRNGREYRVIERRYSLSPERSGELRIPPVRFEGSVRADKGQRGGSRRNLFDEPFFDRFFGDGLLSRDPFGMFDGGPPVSTRSSGVTLHVKARPGGYAGDHWLPAEELEIIDSWADNPPELRVGEPVTRTLTLQAKGLSGPQIPKIPVPATPGLRIYPEKTSSESRSDGETVYGISRQDVTLIPTRAGDLAIPDIRVTWWNTAAQQERTATVPGWTLNVVGGSGAGSMPETPTQSEKHPVPDAQDKMTRQIPEAVSEGADIERWFRWIDRRYLGAGAVALALLLTGAGTWGLRHRRRLRMPPGPARHRLQIADQDGFRIRPAEARKALRTACETNDARGASKALLDWAEATWTDDAPRNLAALGARLSRGKEALAELERRLYASESDQWDGAALWRTLQGGLSDARAAKRRPADALEPLYPRRSGL